jgi:hypothetical protein
MKDCCKTGDEMPQSKFGIWAKRITWGLVSLLVVVIALMQIFNL